jgi:hypothetical protein
MTSAAKRDPRWLRPLTRAALILSIVVSAVGWLASFINLTSGFVVFWIIFVGLALDIAVVALSLLLLPKQRRRPNLTVGVVAFVVLIAPLAWFLVLNGMPN